MLLCFWFPRNISALALSEVQTNRDAPKTETNFEGRFGNLMITRTRSDHEGSAIGD